MLVLRQEAGVEEVNWVNDADREFGEVFGVSENPFGLRRAAKAL
jgi:hypothetical protein